MKVISDINIICINQKTKEVYNDKNICVDCKKNPYNFYTEWRILSMLNGNWHQITPINRTYGVYNDDFFELITSKNKCYISIDNDTSFNTDFVYDLIRFYLNVSLIHKICMLFRLNYQKEQKIKGVIKLKDFMKRLENNKILFDSAYIIGL